MSFNTSISIAGIDLFPIATGNGVSPQMAIGAMPVRPALLLRITDSDGCYGWGEVWANFPPRANLHKAHVIEDVIAPALNRLTYEHPAEIQQRLRQTLSVYFLHVGQQQVFEHILAGIDVALWDLALRKHGLSAIDYFDLKVRNASCYASSINADDMQDMIPQAAALGQQYFKIKIGYQPDNGYSLVERASAIVPDGSHVMIDSNQSWTLEQAVTALQSLQDFSPFFAEEPLAADASLHQWEALAKTSDIPLAGGENIYGVDSFVAMANAGLSFLQPDVAKWGGISGALQLADALPEGVHLWPHFMGTAVGQMASLALTAVIGGGAVCEMDCNKNPLRTQLCGNVIQITGGLVPLHDSPGLVPQPDPDALTRFGVALN